MSALKFLLKMESSYLAFFSLITLALTAGVISSFAMAPYHWWPLLVPGFSALYLLLNHSRTFWKCFALGWVFGFGYFAFSLSWIGNALLVEGNDYAWAWPLAVSGLPALLAFFPALACGAAIRFFSLSHWHGWLGFCGCLAASEWLRGHVFTGFPWNLYGYAWGEILPVLQILSISDVYTLTLLTILLCSLPALWISSKDQISPFLLTLLITGIFSGIFFYGQDRLSSHPLAFEDNIHLKIVQPNIAQHEKWAPQKIRQHFEALVRMSFYNAQGSDTTPEDVTLIVWPETALHFIFLEDKNAREYIARMLQSYPGEAYLLSGTLVRDHDTGGLSNSLVVLNSHGERINQYDKSHLVPFGEYIPFQDLIPLETVSRFSGFTQGHGPQTLSISTLKNKKIAFSPLICYEILFPGYVIDPTISPDLIINITNDAWYGYSPGPYQHFLKAQYRAIEEGVPVIRAANTGISGVIDPYGRVLSQSNLFENTTYTMRLVRSIAPQEKTILSTVKHHVFYLLLLNIMLPRLHFRRRNTRLGSNSL